MSLFGAGMADPSHDDLEGLLVGPGSIERRGDAARISVVVAEDWRAEVMLRGLTGLGCRPEVEAVPDGLQVRTAHLPQLYAAAERWHGTYGKQPPQGLRINGARLWWWCVAAGGTDASGYRLGLGRSDGDAMWSAAGAALHTAGVPAALVGPRADGPAYRVVGTRRLVRLAELVGALPHGVPAQAWPRAGAQAGLHAAGSSG